MAIWEHIRNSTIPYRLYTNGSPGGTLFNCGSGIAELTLRVKTLNKIQKSISSAISSQQISDKNSENK